MAIHRKPPSAYSPNTLRQWLFIEPTYMVPNLESSLMCVYITHTTTIPSSVKGRPYPATIHRMAIGVTCQHYKSVVRSALACLGAKLRGFKVLLKRLPVFYQAYPTLSLPWLMVSALANRRLQSQSQGSPSGATPYSLGVAPGKGKARGGQGARGKGRPITLLLKEPEQNL